MNASKSNLFLSFGSSPLPYAEAAAFYLSSRSAPNASQYDLKIGVSSFKKSQPTLIVKSTTHERPRSTLEQKRIIARYFTRIFSDPHSLYENNPPHHVVEIDDWIDFISSAPSAEIVEEKLGSVSARFLTSAEKITLAEVFAWDFCAAHGITLKKAPWMVELKKLPEVKSAVEKVEYAALSVSVLDKFRYEIAEKVGVAVKLDASAIRFMLETPKDSNNGDYAIPIPRLRLPGNPVQIAKDLSQQVEVSNRITKIVAAGPFVNFFINRNLLRDELVAQVLLLQESFGENASGFGKQAVIDYSSPNIAKPFHAGHLRSTIIGNFIKHILNANGWDVLSMNYLGDWGKQYGLLAVGYLRHGDEELLRMDPIRHLFEVYVKVNAEISKEKKSGVVETNELARSYFKKMEDGDPEAIALWSKFRQLSIEKYEEIYSRINVHFDTFSGESEYPASRTLPVIKELRDLGLLVPDKGAEIVDLNEHNLGVALVAKSDGAMLYLSRDIAAAIDRQEQYQFDKSFYVVGTAQALHFQQLFKILELMGKPWAANCQHIQFGMIKSKDGEMSTRKGRVVFLEDILNQTQEMMHEVMQENAAKYAQIQDPLKVADLVGISSVFISDMSARRAKDYEFDWDRMLSFEGDTGPYLQYAHARLRSIERNAEESGQPAPDFSPEALARLVEPAAFDLIQRIAEYPDIVVEAMQTLEPCTMVQYLMKLCHAISAAFEQLYVRGAPPELAAPRLAMFTAARITVGNGLTLLGLLKLERM
ncbi:hypothetical protein BJ742DRAFT_770531 [Cladochytrium replicatum]|nr:hypothetical protein BJ742DRAFT_770531 [Cladochytrium replicatum]